MYLPKYHELTDVDAMRMHIERYPLGSWVCLGNADLIANHIPFLYEKAQRENGRLIGHVSRGNPVWRDLKEGAPSVVMFLGPQSYITPTWYPGKMAHGKVVPTWNYATVHVHGVARAILDDEWKMNMLHRLTDAQESSRPSPWKVTDAPSDYVQKLLHGIVGIEIEISRMEGRLKVSQDESIEDRYGSVEGLLHEQDSQAHEMAKLIHQQIGIE